MNEAYRLLLQHGYTIIFFSALGERIGFPLLLAPIMIAAGVMSAAGKLSLSWAVVLTTVAFVAGDLLWYELGRRRGAKVMSLLCKLSLEPDSCVRRSQNFMGKYAK